MRTLGPAITVTVSSVSSESLNTALSVGSTRWMLTSVVGGALTDSTVQSTGTGARLGVSLPTSSFLKPAVPLLLVARNAFDAGFV